MQCAKVNAHCACLNLFRECMCSCAVSIVTLRMPQLVPWMYVLMRSEPCNFAHCSLCMPELVPWMYVLMRSEHCNFAHCSLRMPKLVPWMYVLMRSEHCNFAHCSLRKSELAPWCSCALSIVTMHIAHCSLRMSGPVNVCFHVTRHYSNLRRTYLLTFSVVLDKVAGAADHVIQRKCSSGKFTFWTLVVPRKHQLI
jgi:hypothetical protein